MHDALNVINAINDLDVYVEQPCISYNENLSVRKKTNKPFILDERFKALIKYNWFKYYGSLSGLQDILNQMEKRTKFPSNLAAWQFPKCILKKAGYSFSII